MLSTDHICTDNVKSTKEASYFTHNTNAKTMQRLEQVAEVEVARETEVHSERWSSPAALLHNLEVLQ